MPRPSKNKKRSMAAADVSADARKILRLENKRPGDKSDKSLRRYKSLVGDCCDIFDCKRDSLKNPKGRERTAPEKNTLLLGFRTVGGDLKVDPAYRRKKDLKVPIDTVLNLALDAIDVEENVEGEEENPSDADELVAASLPDLGDGCAFLQAVDEAGETSEDVLVVEEVFGDDGVGGDGWEGGRDDEWCDDVEFVPFRTLAEAWL
mmetsp:Transcript_41605/g.126162  ORF Transcript_41605/g.126162 Transcript_41605/m.126162 type:complete len:205 (-) Transcript_41605:246-860(-)